MKLKFPEMPWYKSINRKLEGVEWLVDLILIGVIVLSIILVLRGDRITKTAWVVYLISP